MSTDTGYPAPRKSHGLVDCKDALCPHQRLLGYGAPLAEACAECGAYMAREEHDASCWRGFINDALTIDPSYTDDTTDLGWR